jgi:hypothetical protein
MPFSLSSVVEWVSKAIRTLMGLRSTVGAGDAAASPAAALSRKTYFTVTAHAPKPSWLRK